ncbi:MAG TPA: hypothetical protein VFD50_06810 [Thermoleophilia bacterium]|nr:hypothetical protein [Thermoleophilia bacterium]
MYSRSRSILLILVVALALLIFAVPAQAATVKVVKGNTQMNLDKNVVKNLVGQNVVVDDISPATLTVNWTSGINWFFNVPIYTGSTGSTYNWGNKTGTLYHNGGIRFANVFVGPKQTRFQGLRVIATGPHTYTLSAAVGTAPAVRLNIATATNTPTFSKSGRKCSIQGLQFRLTAGPLGGAQALKDQLGLATLPSTTIVFFDTDLFFTLK